MKCLARITQDRFDNLFPFVELQELKQLYRTEDTTTQRNNRTSLLHTFLCLFFMFIDLYNIQCIFKILMLKNTLHHYQDRTTAHIHTPSSISLAWQQDIKSLPHRGQIDGSTVHQVHPWDIEIIYNCLIAQLM